MSYLTYTYKFKQNIKCYSTAKNVSIITFGLRKGFILKKFIYFFLNVPIEHNFVKKSSTTISGTKKFCPKIFKHQ